MENLSITPKKLYVKTYGCQMNGYDSERMSELFLNHGYEVSDSYKESDLVILNTCHIREKAAEKTYSELGRINKEKQRLKSLNRNMVITVAGCVAQAEGKEIMKRAPYVDIIVGPQSYHNLLGLVAKINNKENIDPISLDFIEEKKFDFLPEERTVKNTRNNASAFLSIQEGCDKFCTYCVVPYTRGAEFSRPLEQVIKEAKTLIENGAKEINLLGQNVNAYHGKDKDGNNVTLGKLIMLLDKLPGLERIRYTTSHPNDMHDELFEAHASSKKLAPFLHLPIQAGSDKILKKMNRKHSVKSYLDIIKKLEIIRPGIVFSSDFIVGFPGETEEDFKSTIEIVKQVNFTNCYSFKYSERPGTPASLEEDQIPEKIKSERLEKLQDLLFAKQHDFNKSCLDKDMDILFEYIDRNGNLVGKSDFFQSVIVENADPKLLGQLANVKITHAAIHNLKGKLN